MDAERSYGWNMIDMDMGNVVGRAEPEASAAGMYSLQMVPLMDGLWQLHITIEKPGALPVSTYFTVIVRG